MLKLMQKRWVPATIVAVLLILLAAKFFWSLVLFPGVPFGYDAGIYRYLFVKEAQGFPPFLLASMQPWAEAHPLGLFFFSTFLVRAGVPVDWLIGPVWNAFPVVLSAVFGWVMWRREGAVVGILTLFACLLSTVLYQGFLMIYWKVFVALFWTILAFRSFERGERRWVIFGMFAVATHQQIGLVFLLSTLAAMFSRKKDPLAKRRRTEWLMTVALGLLWYVQNGGRAIGEVIPQLAGPGVGFLFLIFIFLIALVQFLPMEFPVPRTSVMWTACLIAAAIFLLLPFTGYAPEFFDRVFGRLLQGDSNPGAFLTIPVYLELSLPLLLLGIHGFGLSLRKEEGTVWQWAVAVCALAVVSQFFFYRRFLLPMDFFLLPFAAIAMTDAVIKPRTLIAALTLVAVIVQGWLLVDQIRGIDPHVDRSMLQSFTALPSAVPPRAEVIVLDTMAPWVAGYLPEADVSGPGIFNSQPLDAWEKFLYGSHDDREQFLRHYNGVYLYATDVFRSYYPPEVQSLLQDPCLTPQVAPGLYRSHCDRGIFGH